MIQLLLVATLLIAGTMAHPTIGLPAEDGSVELGAGGLGVNADELGVNAGGLDVGEGQRLGLLGLGGISGGGQFGHGIHPGMQLTHHNFIGLGSTLTRLGLGLFFGI